MLSKLLSAAEEASRSGGLHQLDYPFWPSEETTSDDMLISRGGTCARTLLLSTRMAASSLSSHLNAPASSSRRIHGLKPFFPQLLSYSPFLSRPSLFSSLASVDSNKLHKKSNHPVAALLEIGGVKIAKDGTFLFVFSIYLRQILKKKREKFILLFSWFIWVLLIDGPDVVRESDPTNNVPDSIFSKIGLQLHRRDNHPIGILKNAIYEYFDTGYSSKFVKFDNLCPVVSVQQVYMLFIISFLLAA